jgi:hypothetical protein
VALSRSMTASHPVAALATLVCMGASVLWIAAPAPSAQAVPRAGEPIAVRNEPPRAGEEVLVLRHQELRKGAHDDYYRASRDGVWPWYEQIGTRIVGQWLVTERDGARLPRASRRRYRLARAPASSTARERAAGTRESATDPRARKPPGSRIASACRPDRRVLPPGRYRHVPSTCRLRTVGLPRRRLHPPMT